MNTFYYNHDKYKELASLHEKISKIVDNKNQVFNYEENTIINNYKTRLT